MSKLLVNIKTVAALWKAYRTIKDSGLFDASFYAQTYPEVRNTPLSPLWHYVCVGAFNGYKPNPNFDSTWYLAKHSDVATTGMNPLVHYIIAGQFESRATHPDPAPQIATPVVDSPPPISTSWNIRDRVARIVSGSVYNEYPAYQPQDTFYPPVWSLPSTTPKRFPESHYQQLFRDAMRRFDDQYDTVALDKVYALLNDLYSREMLVYVLVGRLLGAAKYRLPIHFSHAWRSYPQVIACSDNSTELTRGSIVLNKFDLTPIGHDIRMLSAPMGVFINFILEQYNYGDIVHTKLGDVVIDGGAFLGETALYFAERVGAHGKVYAFEFMPSNVELIHQNLAMNPQYHTRIEIVERPLWSDSITQLTADDRGPGSSLRSVNNASEHTFMTISIDDFVRNQSVPQVDFIKLDIEGAELATIEGARTVIMTFKPQLAICIYHKNSDFWQIPQLLHEMVPEYEFYVDHFVPFPNWETVLFARVRS